MYRGRTNARLSCFRVIFNKQNAYSNRQPCSVPISAVRESGQRKNKAQTPKITLLYIHIQESRAGEDPCDILDAKQLVISTAQ